MGPGKASGALRAPAPPWTWPASLLSSPRPPGALSAVPRLALPAHLVPQVGGRGLPVQLREGLGPAPQIGVEQLGPGPPLVRHHLSLTAQQRPALHVHVLWAHGRGTG